MRIAKAILPVLLVAGACLPASAQYGRVERTQAEIALEQAQQNMEKAKAARSEAIRACGEKDYSACYSLGEMYRRGDGGNQNYELAADAYRKACDGKDARGCAGLAYLTTHGRGVDQDLARARTLYEKSCDLGEISGCAGYGNLLYTGQGGRKNVTEGREYLQKACDADYEWACDRLTTLGAYQPDDNTWERLKDTRSRY